MNIKALTYDVIKNLRSDVTFYTVAQCVEELVWNSIDARANCIAVRLNLPLFKIQVIDNGNGMHHTDLELFGQRYATSKCNCIEDLECPQYKGFRGEAIASLRQVSMNLMIETRRDDSRSTSCKIFTLGRASRVTSSLNPRISKGTTVTVFDFLYNRPVRKKAISETLDLEETRKLLQSIALMNPNISFSLLDETTGKTVLQFKKCSSYYTAFMQCFGTGYSKIFKLSSGDFEDYKISGLISSQLLQAKDIRFLYINKCPVSNTNRLHKLINRILGKYLCIAKKEKFDPISSTPEISSPSKNKPQYCAFLINIYCPRSEYDSIFDCRNTVIEFLDWQKVSSYVENFLLNFLKKENLISSGEQLNEDTLLHTEERDLTLKLGIDNYKNGLFSHAAKRLVTVESNKNCSSKEISDRSDSMQTNSIDPKYDSLLHPYPEPTKSNTTLLENIKSNQPQNKLICLKGITQSKSILDELKSSTVVGGPTKKVLNTDKCIQTKSDLEVASKEISQLPKMSNVLKSDLDIPSGSVFPTESPIISYVPAKCSLSLLEKNSLALQRLREKYQFMSTKFKQSSDVASKSIREKLAPDHQQLLNKKNKEECLNVLQRGPKGENAVNSGANMKNVSKDPSNQKLGIQSQPIFSKYSFCQDDNSRSALLRLRQNRISQKGDEISSITFSDSKVINIESRLFKAGRNKKAINNNSESEKLCFNEEASLLDRREINNFLPCVSSEKVNFDSCIADANLKEDDVRREKADSVVHFRELSKFPKRTLSNDFTSSPNKFQKLDDSDEINNFIDKIRERKSICDSYYNFKVYQQRRINKLNENKSILMGNSPLKKMKDTKNCNLTVLEECMSQKTPHELSINASRNCESYVSNLNRSTNEFQKLDESANVSIFMDKNGENKPVCDSPCDFETEKKIENIDSCDADANSKEDDDVRREEVSSVTHLKISKFNKNTLSDDLTSSPNVFKKLDESAKVSVFLDENRQSKSVCESYCDFEADQLPMIKKLKENLEISSSEGISNSLENKTKDNKNSNFTVLEEYISNKTPSKLSINVNKISPKTFNQKEISVECTNFTPRSDTFHVKRQSCYTGANQSSKSKNILLKKNFILQESDKPIAHEAEARIISKFKSSKSEVPVGCEILRFETETPRRSLNTRLLKAPSPKKISVITTRPTMYMQNRSYESLCLGDEIIDNMGYDVQEKDQLSSRLEHNLRGCLSKLNSTEDEGKLLKSMTFNFDKISCVVMKENSKERSHWIPYTNENTKRVSYINTYTGNSSYIKPQLMQEKSHDFQGMENLRMGTKKRHSFLPHDYTGFMKNFSVKNVSFDNTKELQSDLITFMKEKDEKEHNIKWRDSNTDACADNNISDLLSNWENPMFDIQQEACENSKSKITAPQAYTINIYRFNKASLKNLKVIGQVDCKFIACVIEDLKGNDKESVLALFDQHAVHERIRLEKLTEDLYEMSEKGKKIIKSSEITPFIELSFKPHETRLLTAYQIGLKDIGIDFSVKNETTVEITSIPLCFIDKNSNKLKRHFDEVSNVIEKLIKECLTSLTESRIITTVLPKTLSSILNAQACRGAVKFGDPLDLDQCKNLLSSLSECSLPFQCAHGRPSIATLLDLNKIEMQAKECSLPKLLKLKIRMKESEEEFSSEI